MKDYDDTPIAYHIDNNEFKESGSNSYSAT
jgi:hypothetical protein